MDFMKVLDQTVREIKREVNLKVLKVPEIEQKVLDATNDEAWGPHGSALSEIAQATKKFTECQLIMNVLWTRLTDTGPNWRHVYKALTVIEYLIANGSERAVDDILEHSFQISAISGFEYVEPSGKDVGINVRKKVETIVALLNDEEKIKASREKAAANRDKYVGLSSTGISYKSSSASYGSSSFYSKDRYGSRSREGDSFRDSYKEGEKYGKESKWKNEEKDSKKSEIVSDENDVNKLKKQQVQRQSRNQNSSPSNSSKSGVTRPSKSSNAKSNNEDDDFDDFDPRGSSSSGSANARTNQVDLFGQSLVGDLMDAAPSVLPQAATNDITDNSEADLFADATFQSASHAEATLDSHTQGKFDPFAGQHAFPATVPENVDFFAVPDTSLPSGTKSTETVHTESFDPFAAIPINSFDGSDPFGTFVSHAEPVGTQHSKNSTNTSQINLDDAFGDFTSHTEQTKSEPSQNSSKSSLGTLKTLSTSSTSAAKDNFQVKSGVWADCLSRGLIDLNITAPKKVNLADIGIVGDLEDPSMEKETHLSNTTAFMGRGMSSGSGLGWSGYSTATGGSTSFANFSQQQFNNFK
ncbi:clathrin interactor EPSIN 1 [Canna indica]|uniref:Clathrin interactor EPSIN 1 n=1 Tax=Canna indica TaxID=4628 RepID=A0AAQ3K3F4_9LILI|nr:clathrin interactor EPSIN 1 [Canna indica]